MKKCKLKIAILLLAALLLSEIGTPTLGRSAGISKVSTKATAAEATPAPAATPDPQTYPVLNGELVHTECILQTRI